MEKRIIKDIDNLLTQLFQKMHEAGYEWDANKKELKKIEDENYDGEDYGIDSLFHAQRILEKTLGKVNGYQTDDGILAHKCAITAVNKLYKQKSAWSKEDESMRDNIITGLKMMRDGSSNEAVKAFYDKKITWLKSLKDRCIPQPKQEWSEEDIETLERIISNYEYFCDTLTSKENWSETEKEACKKVDYEDILWLKSLKNICLPQPKQEWSEEDNQYLCGLIGLIEQSKAGLPITLKGKAADNCIDWLKSIRPQKQWKPSDEQMEALRTVIEHTNVSVLNPELLQTLVILENNLKAL